MTAINQAELISQLIVASAQNPMILVNKEGEIIFANSETEKLLAYGKNELIGHPIEDIIAKRYKEKLADSRNIFLGNPKDWVLGNGKELYAARKDETEFPAEMGLIQLVTAEGMLTLIVVIDITEKKLAADTLSSSEKQFREFFENAPEAIAVLDIDLLTFARTNSNAFKLFKYPADALRSMSLTDISPEWQPDGKRSREKITDLIAHALNVEKMFFEWTICDADGNEILCEVRLVALPGIQNRQLLASFIDIAERKITESDLRTAHKRLLFRLENTLLGFIEWDEHLKVKAWSKRSSEIFGWTMEEFMGQQKDVYGLVYEADLSWIQDIAQKLLKGEVERISVLQRNYTKDGRVIWCEWFHSVLKDESGKVDTIMSLVQDVTERKAAETEIYQLNEHLEERVSKRTLELTEANKELEGFSYSVSHDLRSPVRSILGFSKIIKREYGAAMEKDLAELFEYIENCSIRMNTIITDLLTLAKYGKEKLYMERVDMTKLFQNVWNNLKRTAPANIVLDLPVLPYIEGDKSIIEQVLINLLSNAIKYSSKKENPIVQVGFKLESDFTSFFVKDNGVGFNMEYYHRLFGAFQRLHGTSEFDGTGVGLLLVKRIIEKHGGAVWAESKVNEGATFWFTLPKALPQTFAVRTDQLKMVERAPQIPVADTRKIELRRMQADG
jgi:PAS domain S-box-containing protein